MTALIIDDEALSRQELQFLLEDAGGVEILAQGTNGIEAVELIGRHHPDIVFLDVQMPGLDGFAVLKKLMDRKAPMPQVVFATAFDQYAVRAFEVNAVDYLLKPFERKRVLQSLEKAHARLALAVEAGAPVAIAASASSLPSSQGELTTAEGGTEAKLDALLRLMEERNTAPGRGGALFGSGGHSSFGHTSSGKIVVRAQSRLLLVDQREICFAAIEEGAISVVTPTVQGLSNCRTLEELMDQLDPETFWRAHRSFVVNLQHIGEVVPWFRSSYQLRMDDPKKTEIPVSRSQTRRLRDLFNL